MQFVEKDISYEFMKNTSEVEGDCYGLTRIGDSAKKAFFSNPNLKDLSKGMFHLIWADGIVVGRTIPFDTKIKIGSQVYMASAGSSLYVVDSYRKYNVGADLMMRKSGVDYRISAGISDMALPLHKILKFHILEYPRMMLLLNSRAILEMKGIHGVLLRVSAFLINQPLRLFNNYHRWCSIRLRKEFQIIKETVIPEWVDDMILNDGHKYMEVHDRAWLQWNLDNHFKEDKQDIQSFFSVYEGNKPVGFFMTKERFREDAGGKLKNIILAAIVEWGIAKDCVSLSEDKLYKMAISTFSKEVDIIEFATDDEVVCKKMKKWGFIKHGFAHIAFKDNNKDCKDASDIRLWRVRYGYADVILT